MRAQDKPHEHIILHNIRCKTAKLWNKKYALAGAILGVASDPEQHAETAFLQYPTPESPNQYHIYQGTKRSGTIMQEDIPSWWVVLALVLRQEGTDGGPNQHLARKTKQHPPAQDKRGRQATSTNDTRRVKKTIHKRQNAARSQGSGAAQRRRALQAITQATAAGRPAGKPKQQRATYKIAGQQEQTRQRLLALTAPSQGQPNAIDDASDDDPKATQQDKEHPNGQTNGHHYKEPRYSTHLEDQSLQASLPKMPRCEELILQAEPQHPQPPTEQQQQTGQPANRATRPCPTAGEQAANDQQLPIPPCTMPTDGDTHTPARALPRPPAGGPGERDAGAPAHRYGLITLFDGCLSTHDLITEAVGSPPTVCIAAENDAEVRRYVAAKNKWNLDGEWFQKGGSHYRYLKDVDELVSNHAAVLQQALALAPNIPYILIAGTPCQDLTTIGRQRGTLGLAGPRSIYFYVFQLTLHHLQQALPPHHVLYVLENAASMQANYKQAIQLALGNPGHHPQLRTRDSGQHTPAHRRRYYFTNSLHTAEPPNDAHPWSNQWITVNQVTQNPQHKMQPIVRPQGHDRSRGMHRHSHIALHPYSLLYHQPTLPPEELRTAANRGDLLTPAFWKQHLPPHIADTYCRYLALETKHARNKQQDDELDTCTEVLSHTFQNPCMRLPVRPLDAEEALAVTGIAAYVPPRQDLTPYRTERLCQSLAGNSFHPNLVLATLGGEENLQQFASGTRSHECTDTTQALAPHLVREHFATAILAPLLQSPDHKKHLLQAWRTQEAALRSLTPYRHLQTSKNGTSATSHPKVPPIQYGQPDDYTALYRQAQQHKDSEEAHANHQLVPGLLAGAVHDHLVATGSEDLLRALRATRYEHYNRAEWIKELVGTSFPQMIEELPGVHQQHHLTSLVGALQWWAAQPPHTVAASPAHTVVLIHMPSAEAPILLHIGTKQPRIAHYVQQYAEQPSILVGTIAYNSRQAEPAGSYPKASSLAEQLGLQHLPAPTLRIKDNDKPTVSLSAHQGIITRHAADWDYPVKLRAPTSCICCHYKAHLTSRTIRPNESHCAGTFLQTLLAESICLTVSYAAHEPAQPATATIQHVRWDNPELRQRPLHEHTADIPYIILARKARNQHPGPSLHPALTALLPLSHTQPQDGTPTLQATNASCRCGALTPAILEESDALLLTPWRCAETHRQLGPRCTYVTAHHKALPKCASLLPKASTTFTNNNTKPSHHTAPRGCVTSPSCPTC